MVNDGQKIKPSLGQRLVFAGELICKAETQYLLTCKVSRYCVLALHSSVLVGITHVHMSLEPCKHETLNNVGFMLGHRRTGWASIKPALTNGSVRRDVAIWLSLLANSFLQVA